jgi:transposase
MHCKKTVDARSYSHEMLEALRRDAVLRVEQGESPEAVAQGLGINRRTIYRWLAAYHYGGDDALAAKPIPGAPPKLDAKQMARLVRLIKDKTPQQYKFEYALWTLAIIRALIERVFGVRLSEVSVSRLMKRLGFTPQRPLYRAWQQDAKLVERWREQDYPRIAARAKREGALVMFADESGIRSDHHAGTTWSPQGRTPRVQATGARFGLNMLSAISARGDFRFMTHEGRIDAAVFCEFLRRMLVGMSRKVFLIVDGHPVHKSAAVKRFAAQHADELELFYLPPYSPELNPDEHVWGHVKTRVGKTAVKTKASLKKAVDRALRSLQKLPAIVAGFFQDPSCRYAAA